MPPNEGLVVLPAEEVTRMVAQAVRDALGASCGRTEASTPWLTTTEAAEYLRVSPSSVYHMVSRKEIPSSRVGRVLRFNRDELDRWVADSDEL